MRLKGEMVDRLRQALGGKTPTPRRIEKLLEEIEQKRSESPAPALIQAEATGTSGSSIQAPPDDKEARLLAIIAGLEARIEEIRKPPTEEERDRAIGDGRLPVATVEAPPLGYTGSAELPRGIWFKSPLGPRIDIKLCDCPTCTPYRFHHYFCVVCHGGPFNYLQRHPAGRKMHPSPGSTWGLNHECCSAPCWTRYQESLGVMPGVNDFMSLAAMDDPSLPDRPKVSVGSD